MNTGKEKDPNDDIPEGEIKSGEDEEKITAVLTITDEISVSGNVKITES